MWILLPDSGSAFTKRAEVDFENDLKLDCLFEFVLKQTANQIRIQNCEMIFEEEWSPIPKIDEVSSSEAPVQ